MLPPILVVCGICLLQFVMLAMQAGFPVGVNILKKHQLFSASLGFLMPLCLWLGKWEVVQRSQAEDKVRENRKGGQLS